MNTNWCWIWQSVWISLRLCIYHSRSASAVMLGLEDPIPSLLVILNQMFWTSTLNVLCVLILFQFLRILPCLSLVYIADTANLFRLFWELLQCFLLYSVLYLYVLTFSRTILTLCSLQFLFFLQITIQSLLLPAPIGTNLFHRLLHSRPFRNALLSSSYPFWVVLDEFSSLCILLLPFLLLLLLFYVILKVHTSRYFLRENFRKMNFPSPWVS